MPEWVIDTNVLLVATRFHLGEPPAKMRIRGQDVPVANMEDQKTVYNWLRGFHRNSDDILVLDVPHNLIKDEYSHKLEKHEYGRMMIAEKFSRGEFRICHVEVDENGDAIILHEAGLEVFDKADRRMVAAALESGAPIVNACDTDWYDLEDSGTLGRLGIRIEQVIDPCCRKLWKEMKKKAGSR